MSKTATSTNFPQLRFSHEDGAPFRDWQERKLKKLGRFLGGGTPSTSEESYWQGNIPWISSSDISDESIHNVTITRYITERAISESATKLVPSNSILLVSRVGVGKLAVSPIDLCTSQDFTNFIPSHDNVYFLAYQLHSQKNKLVAFSQGTSIKGFTISDIGLLKIALPELEEQRKIAAFFSAVDAKLDALRRKRGLLAEYKRGVMQKLFSQEIRFVGDGGRPYADWERKRLSKVLIPDVRKTEKPSTNYLALGVRSHMNGTFQKPGTDPTSNAMEQLFVVRAHDLIVNITFAWEGAIAIARPEDDGGLVSHRFPTYRFKEKLLHREFFRYVIQQERFKHILGLISPGGAGRNRVMSKMDFLKITWLFPSLAEQKKIAGFLNSIDAKITAVDQQIAHMEAFKKGLLQQMFV